MRTLVIGLDCAAPEIVFGQPQLVNLQRLMSQGCYGRLESVIPPITVPAWMCMATSQDPGSLGIYGFRNRTGYSYDALGTVTSRSITAPAIWDYLEPHGDRAIIVGVPPNYPPRRVNGLSIGCFLTPDPAKNDFTYPKVLKATVQQIVGDYPVDVSGFRTDDKAWLKRQIWDMTRKHFEVLRYLMADEDWQYFQFVEIGLDRVQHGFWKYHDREHRQYVEGNPFESVVLDYYQYLDAEIGTLLDLVTPDDTVLVVSDHGAQRLDGGFCVNEWLRREGWLTLLETPAQVKPFSPALVDWSRTRAWSEGGYYARIFVNVAGREPAGIVPAGEYEAVLHELQRALEALVDDRGAPMGTQVFRPHATYRQVNGVPPDLIAHFGGLRWRSIGGVGHRDLYLQENDTGPDDCNHAQFGTFVLRSPAMPLRGEIAGTHLLDIAPTLLDLAGHSIPPTMQGQSLLRRR